MEQYETEFIEVGDIRLHTVLAGPQDGDPLILLHGFPEYWYGWRKQIPYFAEQGYRVIVPDQRGYNLSDKPESIDAYQIDILAGDVQQLIEVLGYERVYLAGHDWGAAVAWQVATIYPERLHKLVILNVPYPTILTDYLRQGYINQLFKSWYIGFFQIPLLPESILSANNYRGLEQSLKSGNLNAFTAEDVKKYKVAWSQPGAVTAMLNWYRAAGRSLFNVFAQSTAGVRITVPTLMLWGEQDIALSKDLAQPSIELCDDGELVFFPNATHWVQHDEAESVNQLMHEFLMQESAGAKI